MQVPRRRTTYHLLGLAALLAGTGCPFDTGPGWTWVVQPGLIAVDGLDPVSGPDTVQRGASFTLVVKTFGSSSCTRPAGADVAVSGLTATVIPMDSVVTGDAICTADLRSFPHNATLVFGQPGEATLIVVGRGAKGDTSITYPIVVR